MTVEVRFIADAMLGKLATWLRILGCDVEYLPAISDGDLVETASRTGRVILTRDLQLIRRRKARDNHFFVKGDCCKDQLRQVVDRFSIDPLGRVLTRCLRCNRLLEDVDRSAVRDRVPSYVYETQHDFKTCGSCGRIYWRGTHRDEALKRLREIIGP
jgi:uncharacterized protein with PIN domain